MENLCRLVAVSLFLAWVPLGCSTVPSKYVHDAVPGVTLTALTREPERYLGKVVIVGGVLVEEREDNGRLWLRMKNRPLDQDYQPHRPAAPDGPEGGHYWITASDRQEFPERYRKWARMTVVGKVVGTRHVIAQTGPSSVAGPRTSICAWVGAIQLA